MTKSLFKDLIREIWKSKNRFISILCIVAIGVAFFAGLKSSAPDMAYTIDNYFDEYNIQDLQIISPLGLTEEDIQAIREVDGVESVQPGFLTDVVTVLNDTELVFRLHSLPNNYVSDSDAGSLDSYINRLNLKEGRLPEKPDEIVVQLPETMAGGYTVKIGDVLKFSSGTSTVLTDGTLYYDEYTVVGLITTPLYLTYEMGTSQTISNKTISLFAYIPEAAFDYKNMYLENENVYLEAVVTIKDAKKMECFDDDTYQVLIDKVKSKVENVAVDRAMKRADQLREYAQGQLDDAQAKYDKESANYEKQIADAQKMLDDSYKKLTNGDAELKSEQAIYEAKIADAEADIKAAEKQITESEKAIKEGEAALNKAQKEYNDALAENKDSIQRLDNIAKTTKELAAKSDENRKAIQQKLNDPDLSPEDRVTYMEMLAMYDEYDELLQEASKGLNELNNGVSEIMKVYEAQLSSAKRTLNESKAELAKGKKDLANGKAELKRQKANAQSAFRNGKAKLEAAWKQYYAGKKDFEKQKLSGKAQLESAEDQLATAQRQIDQIEEASWFVFDRNYNYGYASYDNTVSSMSAMAQFLPVFFILVAILVCMTTMTRMIDEQRGIIGTYKALGYSNASISAKYILYVLIASIAGSVIGAVVGIKLFPYAVYNAWSAMYSQPKDIMQAVHPSIIISSFAITTLAMVLTAYFVCRSELNSVPSALMRPKAPKLGKAIFLERIPFFWNHLNFSQKVTARNIFRYKKRLCMTIIGIMGCTALLLCGLGMNDTISSVVKNQYGEIFKFGISYSYTAVDNSTLASLSNTSSDEEDILDQRIALDKLVSNSDIVDSYTRIGSISVTAENKNGNNGNNESVTLYVTEDAANLTDYIVLRNRASGTPLELSDNGIIITEKLADRLDVSIGDSIDVTSNSMTKKLEVTGITENYVQHYAYMTQEAYKETFWYTVDQNTILINVKDSVTDKQYKELVNQISDSPAASSVMALNSIADSFDEQFTSLNQIVMLIIICAALLAFVVLYNLTNINVSERLREIATIKVLGFKNKEVAIYVYSENLILTLMGAVLGLSGGVVLHRFIIKMIEQKNVMFGYVIEPLSFVNAILLTCAFSIVVMIYMYRSLVNIPMVESLKSVE